MSISTCIFCKIVAETVPAAKVYEDENTIVFLDNGPLFPGHCLICPKVHYDTLLDLPAENITGLFSVVQLMGKAVERALGAEGSFVAVNNKISQSVPHLHVHVIPRKKGDGLKGFFWPRRPYQDNDHLVATQNSLREAVASLQAEEGATNT